MAKRVFLCTDTDYPRLDAASNYVGNLAKSFTISGHETFIISIDRNGDKADNWQINDREIRFYPVKYRLDNKFSTLRSKVTSASKMIDAMKRQNINEYDVLIIYLYKWYMAVPIVNWAKKNNIPIWASVVEWFEKDTINQNRCFAAYAKCDGVIAISKKIEYYFAQLGLKTMIVPPLVDVDSERKRLLNDNSTDSKVRFLYTGNFVGKDDMKVMLEALALLPEDKRNHIEYHITRFDEDSLVKASGIDEATWCKICDSVVTHGDVSQEQLEELLENTDFLTIARQKNRTTESNFPSKIPEAMAYGIIPIMTKVGDCPDDYLTDGHDSILFENCDAYDCSKAYLRALEYAGAEYLSEMKKNAYETSMKLFSVEGFSDRLVEILE